jgi:hypothetical protein
VNLYRQITVFGIFISLMLTKNENGRLGRYSYHKLKSPFRFMSVIRGAHEEHVNLSQWDTLKPSAVHARATPHRNVRTSAVSCGSGYTNRASCVLGRGEQTY